MAAGLADVRIWHECDIARSRMDVRFRGKSGRAADMMRRAVARPRASSIYHAMPRGAYAVPLWMTGENRALSPLI
jgi:hypothetical protein